LLKVNKGGKGGLSKKVTFDDNLAVKTKDSIGKGN